MPGDLLLALDQIDVVSDTNHICFLRCGNSYRLRRRLIQELLRLVYKGANRPIDPLHRFVAYQLSGDLIDARGIDLGGNRHKRLGLVVGYGLGRHLDYYRDSLGKILLVPSGLLYSLQPFWG